MRRYILIRLLLIFPTMIIISMIAFLLSNQVPQDPVVTLIQSRGALNSSEDVNVDSEIYKKTYEELNRNKPDFYFSLVPHTYPHTFNDIHNPVERAQRKASLTKNFFWPKFCWNGLDNRYHSWVASFVKGNFGESLVNSKPVLGVVMKALAWTAIITLLDLIMSFTLGISIGLFLAKNPKSILQKVTSQFLYLIYSMPKFWLATMLVIYFTTSDYGNLTNIFPSVGIDLYPGKSTFYTIFRNLHKLILPVICLSLFSIAAIARLLQRGLDNEMKEPYITTALSKGLTQKQALKKHGLPNALTPLITVLSGAIPTSLAGSVIIEVIFNIPGIGRLIFESIMVADWNVVYCILMLISLVTIISFLLADIIYAYMDPRIRLA